MNSVKSTLFSTQCILSIAILCAVVALASCTGSKSLGKKGDQLMEAGLYVEAADFYYNALLRNNTNVDARIGLTKSGQRVLDDKLADFNKKRLSDSYEDAVYAYIDAMNYRDKVAGTGVKLQAPDYLAKDFEEAKALLVKRLYDKGLDQMNERQWDAAKATFQEISRLEPGYKDVADMERIARNEPKYQAGLELLNRQQYRQAYPIFDEIYIETQAYKDVSELRAECLDKGQYPVAISDFVNSSSQRDMERRLQAFVVSELAASKDPFLKVIERSNTAIIIKEQRLSLGENIDQRTAVQVGNLLGAKAILSCELISYKANPGRMKIIEKQGYSAYQVKLYNAEKERYYFETRYAPATYKEYFNANEVTLTMQYKLISLETGAILFSRIIEKNESANVYYAVYDGEVANLWPASDNGAVASNRDRQRLQELIRSNRELKSIDQLANESCQAFARQLTSELITEIQTK